MPISDKMQHALTQCVVARAMYKANPTQDNLSTWDDKWTALMEVQYASPSIDDTTWSGLCQREEELMPVNMAIITKAQQIQHRLRDGLLTVVK